MTDSSDKRIYFASDFHLGAPSYEASLVREKRIVAWLDHIKDSAQEIYLVGDIFDFWFEYKRAIPKGFVRLQGKIAELTDQGIPIHVFTGNHDMWIFDYLPKELGVELITEPIQRIFGEKKFFLGHGDGLGPGDHGYKFIKKVFSFKFFQWCFARLHPNFGIWAANFWSGRSKESNKKNLKEPDHFLGPEKEWLVQFCEETNRSEEFDYFIFGHRHLLIDHPIGTNSRYINLGDWYTQCNYAEFDGQELTLKVFED